MTQALGIKLAAGFAALALSSTAANAQPVKMSDQKLDNIVAGSATAPGGGLHFFAFCSFGNNCSGNGGNGNGNTHGAFNIGNGNFAGSAILSGLAVYVLGTPRTPTMTW